MMIKVFGVPAAKGSMKCIGARGVRGHQLVEVNAKKIGPWRKTITDAGRAAVERYGPISGPIVLSVVFTVPRPPSVPLSKRAWPITRSSGDGDKALRLVFDALDDAGMYGDDAQIVMGSFTKAYPDTPGVADRLDRPGAIIRIESLT